MVLGVGLLRGVIGVWVGAWLYGVTGKWIGGLASFAELRAAIAWSSVPMVLSLLFWIPMIVLLGPELFTEEAPTLHDSSAMTAMMAAFAGVSAVLGFWTIVLLCNTIAEVQGFRTAWKGLLNIVLSVLLVFVPLMTIAMLVMAI